MRMAKVRYQTHKKDVVREIDEYDEINEINENVKRRKILND